MITKYAYANLGHADHGWLDARHHFSFARYYNPERMNFGTLRVINDDRIAGHKGFGTHPHDNMEIITYVRSGAISHKDSMGNHGKTKAGDVQVMSAGSGIAHSEFNHEDEETTLFQIWIEPSARNVKPRWDTKQFPKNFANDTLPVLASGRDEHKDQALTIHQDAALYGGRLKAGSSLVQPIKHQAYIIASDGRMKINDVEMERGDGAEVTGEKSIRITALSDAEIIVIDAP